MTRLGEKISPSEITAEGVYPARRRFLQGGAALALSALPGLAQANCAPDKIPAINEPLTDIGTATRYNNYYEFSTDKKAVIHLAREFNARPWTVSIEGEVQHPGIYDIDELLRLFPAEERIYRLRCVEGWSIVVPWTGFPLCELLKRADPTLRLRRNYPYLGKSDGVTQSLRRKHAPERYVGLELEVNQCYVEAGGPAWTRLRGTLVETLGRALQLRGGTGPDEG